MPHTENFKLIDLTREIKNPVLRAFYRFISPAADRLLGITALNRDYRRLLKSPPEEDFFTSAMRVLGLSYAVAEEDLERIPKDGPIFVVGNHPFGGADGIVMGAIMSRARPDFMLLANSLLCHMEGIRPWMFPVNPFGGAKAQRENLQAMRKATEHLSAGGCLGTFPSGEVSAFHFKGRHVSDPKWNPHIARMVRKSKASVLPVFFHGRNSLFFQIAGIISPALRTGLLMRELVKRRDVITRLRIGNPIPFSKLEAFETDEAMIEFLRLGTYALHDMNDSVSGSRLNLPRSPAPGKVQHPIIPAVAPALIKAEIESLPADALIAESNALKIFVFHGNELPHTLREIGRLREVTFRAVSEGTGKACDLDDFDNHYEHLVLYDSAASSVVGAYRLGLTDVILENLGKHGLYSSTLFRFRSGFFMKLNPAIELGRSFIRQEYQRKPACMPMLWKGITGFVARNPRYTKLFGPVSINPEYNAVSRKIILEFLKKNAIAGDLAPLVRAKNPPRRMRLRGADMEMLLSALTDIDDISSIVSGIEADKKPVPVLLKHYLKLNGQLISFNIDPDFGECLDGLIVVDVPNVDAKILKNYMGADAAKNYLAFHGQKLKDE